MEQDQLNQFRTILLDKKQELNQSIALIEKSGGKESMKESLGELSLIDNHPADIGDALFERSKDMALEEQTKITLKKVEDALVRLEEGSYGFCTSCQKPIGEERLQALPEAAQCSQCRRDFEGEGNLNPRPVEEEILPFTFEKKRGRNETQFDKEDSWQAVARYGSSDTPADLEEQFAKYPNVYLNWEEDRDAVEDIEKFSDRK